MAILYQVGGIFRRVGRKIMKEFYDPKDTYVIPKKQLDEYEKAARYYREYVKGDPDVVSSGFQDKVPLTHVTRDKGILKKTRTSIDTDLIGGPKNYLNTGFKDPPRRKPPRKMYADPLNVTRDMYSTSPAESDILVDYVINRHNIPYSVIDKPEIYNVLEQIDNPVIKDIFTTFKQQAAKVRQMKGLTPSDLQKHGISGGHLRNMYPKAERALDKNAEKLLDYISKFKETDSKRLP